MKNHFSLGRQKAQLLVCVHVLEMVAAFSQFTGARDNKSNNISRPFIIDNLECCLFIVCLFKPTLEV